MLTLRVVLMQKCNIPALTHLPIRNLVQFAYWRFFIKIWLISRIWCIINLIDLFLHTKMHRHTNEHKFINRFRMLFYEDHQDELWVYLVMCANVQWLNTLYHRVVSDIKSHLLIERYEVCSSKCSPFEIFRWHWKFNLVVVFNVDRWINLFTYKCFAFVYSEYVIYFVGVKC